MSSLLAFLGVSVLLIVVPGQDTATSLLPQFGHSFAALLGLGLVFCAMTLVWLAGYAVVVAQAGDLLRRSRVRRALDAVTGSVLVAFGLRLASERS